MPIVAIAVVVGRIQPDPENRLVHDARTANMTLQFILFLFIVRYVSVAIAIAMPHAYMPFPAQNVRWNFMFVLSMFKWKMIM